MASVKLGSVLVREGVITAQQLEEALRIQVLYGGRLGTNLVELRYVDVDRMAEWLGRTSGFPVATEAMFAQASGETLSLLSSEMVERFECFPLRQDGRRLHLAMVNPSDLAATDALSFKTGLRIVPYVVPELRLYAWLEKRFAVERKLRYIRLTGKDERTPPPPRVGVVSATATTEPALPPVRHAAAPAVYNPFAPASPRGPSTPPPTPARAPTQPGLTPVPGPRGQAGGRTAPPAPPRLPGLPPLPTASRGPATLPPTFAPVSSPPPMHTRPEVRPVSAPPAMTPPAVPRVASVPPTLRPPAPPQASTLPAVPRVSTPPPPVRPSATPPSVPRLDSSLPPGGLASTPPASAPLSLAEAIHALETAPGRDEIAETLLRYGLGQLDSVMLFLVRDGMALGWKGRGTRLDPGVVELLMLPLNAPSIFQDAHDGQTTVAGPVTDQTLHRHFYKALRRDPPQSALVVPVVMRERVVNLIYGDRLERHDAAAAASGLAELASHVSSAYERIVRESKKRHA